MEQEREYRNSKVKWDRKYLLECIEEDYVKHFTRNAEIQA